MYPLDTVPVQTATQLSTHLKSLRKLKGLTQAELGARIGVKQVRIADIERDPGAISVGQLIAILHALDARLQIGRAQSSPSVGPLAVREGGTDW